MAKTDNGIKSLWLDGEQLQIWTRALLRILSRRRSAAYLRNISGGAGGLEENQRTADLSRRVGIVAAKSSANVVMRRCVYYRFFLFQCSGIAFSARTRAAVLNAAGIKCGIIGMRERVFELFVARAAHRLCFHNINTCCNAVSERAKAICAPGISRLALGPFRAAYMAAKSGHNEDVTGGLEIKDAVFQQYRWWKLGIWDESYS